MKRLFVLMSCAVLLSACATRTPMPAWKPAAKAAPAPQLYDVQGNPVEHIAFRSGVSSVTVEKLAQAQGCTGGQGAGLTSAPGPVETYRMVCDSYQVFTARCEFRQCKPMTPPPPGGYAKRAPAPATLPEPVALPAPQPASMVATSPVAAPAASVATTMPAPQPASMVPASPVAAPAASAAATMPAPAVVAPANGALVMPKLSIRWDCGKCVENLKATALIIETYEKEARSRGITVSDTETAALTITRYRQRNPGVRVMFGIMSGHDVVYTQTQAGGKSYTVNETSVGWGGINSVLVKVGQNTFASIARDK